MSFSKTNTNTIGGYVRNCPAKTNLREDPGVALGIRFFFLFPPRVSSRRILPYKTLPWRLRRVATRPAVNLSLPHGQVFVGDSRTQGWHCRGHVAVGSRSEGGTVPDHEEKSERVHCLFLFQRRGRGGGMKGDRTVRSPRARTNERTNEEGGGGGVVSSMVVSVPEPQSKKERKEVGAVGRGWCRRRRDAGDDDDGHRE